ncbi:hypothetical protein GCM10010954_15680 [Halobacillus andaensis]|uniref:Regulatory protein YycH domain-containing protein n=1 Tax=Halobacillus andaensis TaxID=1176239 RepID=A0A917EX28_HALAA|nr:two-component system activity regulator YycH [Halobacillus andaensis]MBP2004932.1 regulatory protein YycH of two-component signal transduction system YycFG [Halobacillus andaensis]GGF17786.1 hypothetical protein GCM10010954_15680 [Halobacillus andaensis]
MNVETLKSVILVILIGFSLLLTVALWNYQPEYESEGDEERLIEETTIGGEELDMASIVRPKQFVFHRDGDHYSFENKEDVSLTYSEMKNWTLSNFVSTENTGLPSHEDFMAEVVFPTNIPAQAIPQLFSLDNSDIEPPSGQFNRIFVMFNEDDEGAELLFTSDQASSTSFRATINNDDANQLRASMNNDELLSEQILFAGDEEKRIYIPREKVSLQVDSVDSREIGILPLRNELFDGSPVVRERSASTTEQRLTDYSRRLEVLGSGNRLEYTKLTSNTNSDVQSALSSFDLLESSVNFVNTHEGWTDPFQLTSLNPSRSLVQYHMYFNDLPLLNSSDDLHKIEVEYDGDEEQRYVRPLRDFDSSFPGSGREEELPSGETVASFLEDSKQYNMNVIEDIQVGYSLVQQSSSYEVYDLKPAWFVLENGNWKEITEISSGEVGEQANAMGTN